MIVKEIKDKKMWETFVLSQPFTLFVQSWQYGEFYKATGENFWILGIFDDEENLIGGSLIVSVHAKRGNFLYLPYGPILPKKNTAEAMRIFINFLKEFAKQKKYQFIRISPFMDESSANISLFKNNGFHNAPMHMIAENTWILHNLSLSEEELLQNMNKNHRNLIRRCAKEGVRIEKTMDVKAIDGFMKIYDETSKRHKFYKFSKDYITKEFKSFSEKGQAIIINAWLSNDVLDSSSIIIYFGKMAVYRHGASLNTDKKIPTSYLIQWEAIREAKKRGMEMYNFWGIAPENASKKHPFFGITHFKKGFGGRQKNLIRCQDLLVSPGYFVNWCVETIRKIKRGF